MTHDNLSCEYFFYEPCECKKCLLLGYHFTCGSHECYEARLNEDNRIDCIKTVSNRCKGRN